MSDDLEAILTGEDGAEDAAAETAVVEETAAAEEAATQPRGEDGKFAAAEPAVEATGVETVEETADVSPASEESEVGSEDKVRTGLEAELARIRAKNRELEERVTQQAQPPEEKPDFFDDPDAALQTMEQRVDAKINRARIEWSEQSARERHEDFDDKVTVFTDLANENPLLWQQMAQSPDPAEFAYKQANQVTKMREFESIDQFEEKVRADERNKAEKAALAKYEARLAELSNLPGSLSDTRAAGGNSSPPVTNEGLEDILGR